ncbi:hypothetical protein G9A89_020405 [Geosiphon pyriformis]|nr:hypothetical protein G9A89_020405 [Geosiphon pyriformis]
MDMTIELAQQIEDNQKMHLGSTLLVFASAPVMIPKTNKCSCQAGLVDNNNITSLICKTQVASYFINLILDSKSSVSVITKHFLEAIGRKINESSTRPMTNIHGDKKKELGIAKAVFVCINIISIKTDIKVFKAKKYTIIVGNEWLKKTKALLDYKLCKLIIKYSKKSIVIKYYHWTISPVLKQNQKEKQSDKSDNDKSDEKKDQKEQKKLLNSLILSLPAMASH